MNIFAMSIIPLVESWQLRLEECGLLSEVPRGGVGKLYAIRQFNAIIPPLCDTNEQTKSSCASVYVALITRVLYSRAYCLKISKCLFSFLMPWRSSTTAFLFNLYYWSYHDLDHSFKCHPHPRLSRHLSRPELGGPA